MKAWLAAPLFALAALPCQARELQPRLFVLSDIGNEPDDQMSLVRLLLYSNEIEIEGIAATTSVWQRAKTSPEIALRVIDGYGEVVPRLREHTQGWPEAATLKARVSSGVGGYGLAAIDPEHPSPGALALLAAARKADSRPLWVSLWGGANTLAEMLAHARKTLSPTDLTALVGQLRVYAISDQDDAGPWLRREFPELFFIVSPSSPDGSDYARATWTGIAGDQFYRNGAGADFSTVSNEWLDAHIRKGPLGAHYPRYMFIMEGDSPSFLGLIPNGLQSGDNPNWGGWGGRYLKRQPYGESRAIWTQGGDAFPRVTSADTVDGKVSDQATVWRWRQAFQHDFAARIDWTVKPFAQANHPPVVRIGATAGPAPLEVDVVEGQPLTLDASASTDPDGNRLTFRWFHYAEAGFEGGWFGPAPVVIAKPTGPRATLTATARCAPNWLKVGDCPDKGTAHVILAASDNGKPALTRYRRIILTITRRGAEK